MGSNTETEYLSIDSINWSNDTTIEFLQLIQTEPAIWDPKHKYNKNRLRKNDAWIRIKENFSQPCTLEELKRKRNNLMTTYREILKKMKGSIKSSSDDDDSYRPSWFAFQVMHSYLSPVYNCSPVIEQSKHRRKRHSSSQSDSYIITVDNKRERSESRASNQSESSDPLHSELDYMISKKRKLNDMSQQTDNESMIEERLSRNGSVNGECDLYGQLLAEKLKQMQENDRLMLMNEIDNLVFKYKMIIIKERTLE